MDKTFAETQGEAPFDWNKWLDMAIKSQPDAKDMDDKYWLSAQWTTCACGNQCAIIPRFEYDEEYGDFDKVKSAPMDSDLRRLGIRFHHEISRRNWIFAKDVLQQIEARSAILIAEELSKLS